MTYKRIITFAAATFVGVIVVGTVGYMGLTGVSFTDSLYMVIITVFTVGYREVVDPQDPAVKYFTMLLVSVGVASWTFMTLSIFALLAEGEFLKRLREQRIKKRIETMRDHFIICGLGQAGSSALAEFMRGRTACVVIEKSQPVADAAREKYPELHVVVSDATLDESLEAAGVERAAGLIAATESDSDNLLIVLTARSQNAKMVITTRASRTENYNKLLMAGANHVVMPNVTGGMRMAATLLRPQVVDFLEVVMRGPGDSLQIEQAAVPPGSPLDGASLMEAAIPNRSGVLILAIKRGSGDLVFNPKPTETLKVGDVLIYIGRADQTPLLEEVLKGEKSSE